MLYSFGLWLLTTVQREPAVVAGLVQAVLAALLAFGVDMSTEQTAAVMGLSAALLAFVVRRRVSPVA